MLSDPSPCLRCYREGPVGAGGRGSTPYGRSPRPHRVEHLGHILHGFVRSVHFAYLRSSHNHMYTVFVTGVEANSCPEISAPVCGVSQPAACGRKQAILGRARSACSSYSSQSSDLFSSGLVSNDNSQTLSLPAGSGSMYQITLGPEYPVSLPRSSR